MNTSDMNITKTCTTCGKELTLDCFPKLAAGKYGLHGTHAKCRPCMSEKSRLYKARKAERLRQQNALEELAKEIHKPKATSSGEVAKPRTYNTVKDAPWDGKLEPIYVRNSGNKHIQSRGF